MEPQDVADLTRDPEVQLIDVREPHEHEAGRIAGSRLEPLGGLAAVADTIDPERPVVFYCRTGARSAMAAEAFAQAGYDARNLDGGLRAWEREGLPLEPEDGVVAQS